MKTQVSRFVSGMAIFILFGNGMCSSSDPTPTPGTPSSTDACQLLSGVSSDGNSETYGLDSQSRLTTVTASSNSGKTVFQLVYDKTSGNLSIIDCSKSGKQISITSFAPFTNSKPTSVENLVYHVDAYSSPYLGNVSLTNLTNTATLVWQGDRLIKVNAKATDKDNILSASVADITSSYEYEYDANGNVSKMSAFNNDSQGGLIATGLAYYITYEYEDNIRQPKQATGVIIALDLLDDGQIGIEPFSAKAVKKMLLYTVDSGQSTLASTTTYANTANAQSYLVKSVGTTKSASGASDTETITYTYSNCK